MQRLVLVDSGAKAMMVHVLLLHLFAVHAACLVAFERGSSSLLNVFVLAYVDKGVTSPSLQP